MKVERYQCENCKCIRKHIDMYNDQYCYECIDLDTGELKKDALNTKSEVKK